MLETCLSGLGRICTSRPFLLRVGFFVVDVLVAVCDCDGHTIRSTVRSRLRGEVGFCLSWVRMGTLKHK